MSGNAERNAGRELEEAGDLDLAVREVIRELTDKRKGGQAELSRILGSAENRLNRFVQGQRDLKFRELCTVVAELGPNAAVFVELVRLRLRSPEPEDVMRYLGLPNGQIEEPFLAELQQLLATEPRAAASKDPGSRRDELRELDDLRFTGAAAAQERTEVVIRELQAGLHGAGAALVRHELALAIGLWATICRCTGRKEAAASAFAIAFELVNESKDREALAILRSRASYLLIDLGHPGFAFSFLNAAAEHFLVSFNRERYGTCLVDRAIALIIQGEDNQAEEALHTALDLLPAEEWRYRAAAFHSLSICAEKRREFTEARRLLDAAISEYGPRRASTCGQFYRAQGRHALVEGRLEEAAAAFRKAAEVLGELGEPFEGELALIEVAEIAVRRGQTTELKQLGREFLAAVPKNSHSRLAKEALIRLANHLLWGSVEDCLISIEACREKLKEAGRIYLLPPFVHH